MAEPKTFWEMKTAVLEQAFLELLNIVAQEPRLQAACQAIFVKMKGSHNEICREHGIEVPDEQATQISEGQGVSGQDTGNLQSQPGDSDPRTP